MQWDDPLDAIAVHAWNGSWGVIAVGLLAGKGLIFQSYGSDPSYSGDFSLNSDQSNLSDAPDAYFRQWGCILGGNGRLLGAQIIYLMWLCGELSHGAEGHFSQTSLSLHTITQMLSFFRQWGCILGGNGRLLGAHMICLMWLSNMCCCFGSLQVTHLDQAAHACGSAHCCSCLLQT